MERITTEELLGFQEDNKDLYLFNVLDPESFKKARIPESKNIPVERDDFVEAVQEAVPGADSRIVVYCANKECNASPRAAEKLDEAGFSQVFDYEGGIKAWQKAQQPIEGELANLAQKN